MRLGDLLKKFANPLAAVIGIEILGVTLMMIGALPREAALFLLGIFAFFVIFAPLKHAALFAVFSIPLYTALPIIESFDSMASWRIIIAILFLRVLTGGDWGIILGRIWRLFWHGLRLHHWYKISSSRSKTAGTSEVAAGRPRMSQKIIPQSPLIRIGILVGTFFALGALSLFVAQEPVFGIRKLLFLANIFALFFVVREIVKSKRDFVDVLKYAFAGSVLALAAGYAQFIAILFVPLYTFWQWWASHVIPVFYGAGLGGLLSYSNTWFSYYEEAEPTLRIFSFFPDSHSFALSMILALPMALTFFAAKFNMLRSDPSDRGRRSGLKKLITLTLAGIIILILLAIIFSGTRGVWVGAIPVFAVLLFIFILVRINVKLFHKLPFNMTGSDPQKLSVIKMAIISFLIFALLFPVSSQLLKFSQMRQGGIVSETTFERISTSFSAREISNLGRIQIWKSTFESIARHPFLGVGIGNYPVVLNENVSATKEGASAHSLYMDVISEMGILAGIVLILIFLEILYRSLRNVFESKERAFQLFSGFFGIYLLWVMSYSVVDVVLLNDKVLLMFVALAALLYTVPRIESSRL